jgi:hypothetical protein
MRFLSRKTSRRLSTGRFRVIFFALILTFSIITSSGIGLFLSSTSVGAKTEDEMVLQEKTQSYAYLNAVSWCVKNGMGDRKDGFDIVHFANWSNGYWGDRISPENAIAGTWWKSTFRVPSSFLFDGVDINNGEASCNTVLSAALTLWGYENGLDLLCATGQHRANGTTCESGNGDFGNIAPYWERYNTAIIDKVYGGETPTLYQTFPDDTNGYPGRYLLYYHAFVIGCSAKETAASSGGDFFYRDVKTVDDDGDVSSDNYEGINKGDRRKVYVDRDNLNFVELTCQEIADRVSQYSEAFSSHIFANPGEVVAPPFNSAICADDPTNPACQQDTTSCSVEGIGWILCPVANAMAGLTDALFAAVSAFMRVEPLGLSPNDNPLYTAWSVMRTVANVAFVVAFLIIIFSQLTGAGVSNYGVKKLLPRLVVGAILVNISFFICAIAVDVSNILGVAIQDVFKTFEAQVADTGESGENWGSIVTSILAGAIVLGGGAVVIEAATAGGVWGLLAGVLPLLVGALFALIVAFLVLLARQALIIMLIVLSPLAFVAYLLPNTEGLFKKWRDLFISLLVLFPLLSLVFGGSLLAAIILRESSNAQMDENAMVAFFLYVGSFAVQAIPFFIAPLLVNLSSGVLNRFAGIVNNRNKGPLDSMRKGAERIQQNAQNRGFLKKMNQGGLLGIGARRRTRRDAINSGLGQEAKRAESAYLADAMQSNPNLRKAMAGGSEDAQQRALASAISSQQKMETEEITAAGVVLKNAKLDKVEMRNLALGIPQKGIDPSRSAAMHAAAVQSVVASNDIRGINEMWDKSKSWTGPEGDKLRATLADSLQSSSSRPAYIGQGAIAGLRLGQHSSAIKTIESAIQANAYSAAKIAVGDQDELNVIAKIAATSADLPAEAKARLLDAARTAITDPELNRTITKNADQVRNIANGSAPAVDLD